MDCNVLVRQEISVFSNTETSSAEKELCPFKQAFLILWKRQYDCFEHVLFLYKIYQSDSFLAGRMQPILGYAQVTDEMWVIDQG